MSRQPGLLITTILLLLAFCVELPAQTIGYWRFEEGASGSTATTAGSILDSAAALNPGNPNGSPTYSSDVAESSLSNGLTNGSSLQFDGINDFVLVPTDSALNAATEFTVEFWMRSNDLKNDLALLVDKSHGFGDITGWFFQSNSSGLVGFGAGSGSSFPSVSSLDNLFDDQWHHLAGTYDGNDLEFWVDGVLQGTNSIGSYNTNTRDIRFGNARNGGRFFSGSLDEVRISNRALNRSEFLTSVPEPSSAVLALAAMSAFSFRRRRKR